MKGTSHAKKLLPAAASVVTAMVASLCCIGPTVLAVAGAGSLGAFAGFEKYRLALIIVTAILLGFAFYLAYRRREIKCEDGSCKIESAGKWNKIGVWSATFFAAFAIFYPHLAIRHSATPNAAIIASATVVLEVKGMTCTGCASHIQTALSEVQGVHRASVSYETGEGVVEYDPLLVQPAALVERVKETGYEARFAPEGKGE